MAGCRLPALLVRKQPAGSTSVLDVDQTTRAAFLSGTDVRTQTLSQRIAEVMANEQLGSRLFGWLGTSSVLLGMIGTYGLAALLVFSRKHELAVRAALGAALRSPSVAVRGACGRDGYWQGRQSALRFTSKWAVAHGSGSGSRSRRHQGFELCLCERSWF